MEKRLLSINDTAQYLGLKRSTLYAWVSQHKIDFVKVGRLVKFDLRKIAIFIEENTVEE